MKPIKEYIANNPYPGRGIIIGRGNDDKAVFAYFISGRSENSRNRVFSSGDNGDIYTKPFDESKVEDPSLIIYRAVAHLENQVVVTNGDQTDTIVKFIEDGKTFEDGLMTREFEPDAPNFTPRISGILDFSDGFKYEMSILKSADSEGSACNRFFYRYPSLAGRGHFIHTYEGNGNPLPTFCGEPRAVAVEGNIDEFTDEIWNNLDEDNKISLFTAYIDLNTGKVETRLINKNV